MKKGKVDTLWHGSERSVTQLCSMAGIDKADTDMSTASGCPFNPSIEESRYNSGKGMWFHNESHLTRLRISASDWKVSDFVGRRLRENVDCVAFRRVTSPPPLIL